MTNRFEPIVNKLFAWESYGMKNLNKGINTGTILICKVPHIAPEAWFHEIYAPPLTENEIKHIADSVNAELPGEYVEFLQEYNGINVFSDSLRIFGLRKSYKRVGDEVYQPYDLITFNDGKRSRIPNSWFPIGNYRFDGSLIVYNLTENKPDILRCDEKSLKILNKWQNLYEFLDKEIYRLTALFDEKGRMIKEDIPTIPGPSEM